MLLSGIVIIMCDLTGDVAPANQLMISIFVTGCEQKLTHITCIAFLGPSLA